MMSIYVLYVPDNPEPVNVVWFCFTWFCDHSVTDNLSKLLEIQLIYLERKGLNQRCKYIVATVAVACRCGSMSVLVIRAEITRGFSVCRPYSLAIYMYTYVLL